MPSDATVRTEYVVRWTSLRGTVCTTDPKSEADARADAEDWARVVPETAPYRLIERTITERDITDEVPSHD